MVSIDIKIYIDKIEFIILKDNGEYKIELYKGKIAIPKAFNKGEQLKYIRKVMATILNQYSVKNATIFLEEVDLDVINMVKMEGVIEEVLASHEVNIWR